MHRCLHVSRYVAAFECRFNRSYSVMACQLLLYQRLVHYLQLLYTLIVNINAHINTVFYFYYFFVFNNMQVATLTMVVD